MSYVKYGSTIAEFVKRFRSEHGLSQTDLSREMGITPQYISNVERGIYEYPFEFCVGLMIHLDPDRQKFLTDLMKEYSSDKAARRMDKRTLRGKGK